MRKSKSLTNIRVYPEDRNLLRELSFELSNIQKVRVSTPEVVRRIKNIPSALGIGDLKTLLIDDAKLKRRLGK